MSTVVDCCERLHELEIKGEHDAQINIYDPPGGVSTPTLDEFKAYERGWEIGWKRSATVCHS